MNFSNEELKIYLKVKEALSEISDMSLPIQTSHSLVGKRVLVRSRMAGVMYGTLVSVDKQHVILENARNLYRWRNKNMGASLNDTCEGGLNDEYTKLSRFVNRLEMLEACSILEVSSKAQISLDNFSPYSND